MKKIKLLSALIIVHASITLVLLVCTIAIGGNHAGTNQFYHKPYNFLEESAFRAFYIFAFPKFSIFTGSMPNAILGLSLFPPFAIVLAALLNSTLVVSCCWAVCKAILRGRQFYHQKKYKYKPN